MQKILKFYQPIFNLFSGEKSKLLSDKIKKEFLFGSQDRRGISYNSSAETTSNPRKEFKTLEDKIQIFQNQLDSLQQKVMHLEAKLDNPKYALRSQNKAPDDTKTIQQGRFYPEAEYGLLFARK
jgi:hypothetical protein